LAVLITGANKGIGLGLVEAFLKLGSHVIAVSKSIEDAPYTAALKAKAIDASPDKLTIIKADLGNADEVCRIAFIYLEISANLTIVSTSSRESSPRRFPRQQCRYCFKRTLSDYFSFKF